MSQNPNTIVGAALRCLLLGIALVATAGSQLRAQPLDSLVAIAEQTHPSVAAARLVIEQADARSRAAAAWNAPSAGLEFSDLPFNNPSPFARGETMLMVEQMIPLFGQNRAMAAAEALGARVGEEGVASIRRQLRARIQREYYTLWLLERRRALNTENVALSEALYKGVETQYTVGRASQSDMLRIALEIERLKNDRTIIDEEWIEATSRLNAILGREPATPIAIVSPLPAGGIDPIDSLTVRLRDHPDLRRMEAMAAMSEAEATAQEAMLKPELMVRGALGYAPEGHPIREGSDLFASIGEGAHGATTGEPMAPMRFGFTASAMLSIPIAPWSRSGPQGRADAARLEGQEQLLRRDAMQREMSGMLQSAVSMARRARFRAVFYRDRQIPLLQQTLQTLRSDYANSRVPFASVVEVYSMLVMTRLDGYMQEMEYAMALSMITELVGSGLK
jgi:cobalt-zinc-cadmium efflux system outer membrane protein